MKHTWLVWRGHRWAWNESENRVMIKGDREQVNYELKASGIHIYKPFDHIYKNVKEFEKDWRHV